MKAERILVEYLSNPLGIDCLNPRIFYNCVDGFKQTAYEIEYHSSIHGSFSTGKVYSSSTTKITYPKDLNSKERVEFRIRLWDENDNAGEFSDWHFFEMGLLTPQDWQAKWITGHYKPCKNKRYPVDCFKKQFIVEDNKKARLYITACGLYQAKINGIKVGDFVLTPGYTDYNKRIQYQTYDVTSLLTNGINEMVISLADGWYRGSVGAWGLRNQYGTETKLLAQLEVENTNHQINYINTDESWLWGNDGPILMADNKDGEIYDANKVESYKDKAKLTNHHIIPSASNNVAVKEHEIFKGKLFITPTGKKVIAFKQNIAGYLKFKIQAHQGQTLILKMGEMLDENNEFTQKNIQCVSKKKTTPLQQIIYTCQEGLNEYKTTFAIFGFQYVLVETDIDFDVNNFEAIAVYSSIEQIGHFESSNPLLDQFVKNTIWSVKNNSLDIPTDCPTRERHGWTGDIQVFYQSAAYLFDYTPFVNKYLKDVFDWQKKDGRLPQIAPYGGTDFYMWTMNGSVGWSDVGILVPYRLYKQTHDEKVLASLYDKMQKYADFMINRIGIHFDLSEKVYGKKLNIDAENKKKIVYVGQSYGEWAEPKEIHENKWTDLCSPHAEVSTAYTVYVLEKMAEIASILKHDDDATMYQDIAQKVKEGYQVLRKTDYSYDTDRQCELIRPLYMDLLTKEDHEYCQQRLIKAMDKYDWRIGTGFLSTPLILYVLEEIKLDYAYKLLENEQMPGWLFMPKNGATTVWESWEGKTAQGGIASLDHYSKGSCVEWLFKRMLGINIDAENHFLITPNPGGHFTYAKASYQSIYGQVISSWQKVDDHFEYEITIPANCEAYIIINNKQYDVTSGTYHF